MDARRHLWIGLGALLALGLGCVLEELDVTGLACDPDHPCPGGSTCVEQRCQPGVPDGFDGGDGDGDDGGDQGPICTPNATRCSLDGEALETCDGEGTGWTPEPCSEGRYCLEAPVGSATCVEPCLAQDDCPTGFYCPDPGPQRCQPQGSCSPPGGIRCDGTFASLLVCDPASLFERVQEDCAGADGYCDPLGAAPACKPYCTLDADCAGLAGTSCNPATRKCMELGYCAGSACGGDSLCVEETGLGGVCVRIPAEDATNSASPPGPSDLACYVGQPTLPDPDPPVCILKGGVGYFLNRTPIPETVGLEARLFLAADVLGGDLGQPLASAPVVADALGKGSYELANAPTHTELVIEVRGQAGPDPFVPTYLFGVYARADDCHNLYLDLNLPSVPQSMYEGYSDPLAQGLDPARGVVLAQVRDCEVPLGARVMHAVGGLSQPHAHFYYLQAAGAAAPDPSLTETQANGWFGAAKVAPIRGLVAALASVQGVPRSLWLRPLRVFPGAVSLVVFERPLAPRN